MTEITLKDALHSAEEPLKKIIELDTKFTLM